MDVPTAKNSTNCAGDCPEPGRRDDADSRLTAVGSTSYSGACPERGRRDGFGAIRSSSGSQANAWTFTGEQTDGTTGLEYLRARYYDNATGRFLSKDPAGTGYRYARGNPVSFMDPSGLYELCGEDDVWGYVCYDSTQVGLPAEPPSSCDVAANSCEWEGGFTAPYENPDPSRQVNEVSGGDNSRDVAGDASRAVNAAQSGAVTAGSFAGNTQAAVVGAAYDACPEAADAYAAALGQALSNYVDSFFIDPQDAALLENANAAAEEVLLNAEEFYEFACNRSRP